jgi:hypothetical protein
MKVRVTRNITDLNDTDQVGWSPRQLPAGMDMQLRTTTMMLLATSLMACGSDGSKSERQAELAGEITNIRYEYAYGEDPPRIIVEYDIVNTGETFPAEFTADIFLTESAQVGDPGHTSVVARLPEEGEVIVTLDEYGEFPLADFEEIPQGDLVARIEVDTADVVPETDEENNVSAGFEWTPEYPDLKVAIDNVAFASDTISIDYTITNAGEGDAPAFQVDVWDDLSDGPAPSAGSSKGDRFPRVDDGLSAGESVSDSISFGVDCMCESGTAWVTVDQADAHPDYIGQATGEVFELDETNNFDSAAW